MKIFLRILKWLGIGIVALVLLVYGVLYAVNWRDQPAAPAAVKLGALYSNHPVVSDQDNGYVFVMGFAAPQGQDPLQRGAERIAWIERMVAQADATATQEPQRPTYNPIADRSAAIKPVLDACAASNAGCGAALQANEQAVAEWLESNGWLLARYQTLLAHVAWLETAPADYRTPMPSFGVVLEAQRMLLARAWLLAGQGDAAGVRALLEPDIRFWRHTLSASGTLLTKMVATAALTRHFAWANLALRRLPAEQAVAAMPELWLQPLSGDERSLLHTLAGEWKAFDRLLNEARYGAFEPFGSAGEQRAEVIADRLAWRLGQPFLQPQDSSNRFAEYLLHIAATLDAPYPEFPQALAQAQRIEREHTELREPFSRIYNLVGDLLSAMGTPEFASYAARVYDIEGVRRLALLAVQLRGRGVTAEQMPLQLADADLLNPYTEKPFLWDRASGSVVFNGLVPGERGHHAFLY